MTSTVRLRPAVRFAGWGLALAVAIPALLVGPRVLSNLVIVGSPQLAVALLALLLFAAWGGDRMERSRLAGSLPAGALLGLASLLVAALAGASSSFLIVEGAWRWSEPLHSLECWVFKPLFWVSLIGALPALGLGALYANAVRCSAATGVAPGTAVLKTPAVPATARLSRPRSPRARGGP